MCNGQVAAFQNLFWAASERLLFHHTNPWELDEALVDWGFGLGVCEAQDLSGLDEVLRIQGRPVTPVLPRMLAEGRMGKKGGVGFYRYPGQGGAVIDPLIEDLIREEAWFAKIERVEVPGSVLVAQMVAPLQLAAAKLRGAGESQQVITGTLVRAVSYPIAKIGLIWQA